MENTMYVLTLLEEGPPLNLLRKYLKKMKFWVREFSEPRYNVRVTAEERLANLTQREDLNPPRAWETCSSLVQIWDWDPLGRGPWPADNSDFNGKDPAPRRKGFITSEDGNRQKRIAGECANPLRLNYISCPKFCTKYTPIGTEPVIYVLEKTIGELERRIATLRAEIDTVRSADKQYRESGRGDKE